MATLRCAAGASPSTALSFLRIAAARTTPSCPTPQHAQAFDFLIPTRSIHTTTYSTRSAPPARQFRERTATTRQPAQPSRLFGTTSQRNQTVALYNPRKDEDGNEMGLEITPRAANVRLLSPESFPKRLAKLTNAFSDSVSARSCLETRIQTSRCASKSRAAAAMGSSIS
jgi:hypothetical protein